MSKKIEINTLWYGDHFIFNGIIHCLIEFRPQDREAITVRIIYDKPKAYGNIMLNFDYGTMVEFIPRYKLTKKMFVLK